MEDKILLRPLYYSYGKIECIEYIMDKKFNFCLGNVIKYVTRAGLKGNALEDLRKARQYLDFEIERLEGKWKNESEDGREENRGNHSDVQSDCQLYEKELLST